jgi:hypothetical protein
MKVAINRCFGGFGISNAAFEKLLERKSVTYEKVPAKYAFRKDNYDYYHAGKVGEDDAYLSEYDFYSNRADPDLIAVLEELGKDAWGAHAEIVIVEVPDNVNWHIDEYDGLEHVAEDHRTWS